MSLNIMPTKTSSRHLLGVATWFLCVFWSSQAADAAPVDLTVASGSKSTNSTNSTLLDPFSTPDYLAPSTFTWEQGIYGVLFIFFGGVELLHGYKYIRFTMLVAGYLVWASTAVMIMIIANINTGVYQSSGVYFAVWFLVGIVGAIISFYLWHVGIILTGAYGAFVLIAVIFTAANVTNYIFRYTFLAICIVAGGYLTKRYERLAVIIATSFGGAYCIMFGIDMFVQDGFRTTFHVMLSQSSAAFYPVAGTWVMIALVPVLAALGIVWELKHHEEPVGSWWLGHGARPLPPLPGEKPPRRCCGITMSRSKKTADAAKARSGSDTTLVPPPTSSSSSWACCLPWCAKRDNTAKKAHPSSDTVPSPSDGHSPAAAESTTMEVLASSDSPAQDSEKTEFADQKTIGASLGGGAGSSSSIPLPVEKENYGVGHETIGHTGVHKVVIQREEREFSLDVDERW